MPLTNSDSLLQVELQAAIFAGLQAEFAADLAPSGVYSATASAQQMKLATAISKMALALITHIVANAVVAPGIATAGSPTNQVTVSPGVLL